MKGRGAPASSGAPRLMKKGSRRFYLLPYSRVYSAYDGKEGCLRPPSKALIVVILDIDALIDQHSFLAD